MSEAAHEVPNITCIPRINTRQRQENMAAAFKLDPPRLRMTPIVQTKSLAIVGGGPSLKDTWQDINNYDTVMSCGSTHDHLTGIGVHSDYHLECDPDIPQVKYYQSIKFDCTYLIASRCHPSMFKRLKNRDIKLWHMWEDDIGLEPYRKEPAVRGAISCVLCALATAIAMGFQDIHFFGFDSSFAHEAAHHAYPCEERDQVIKTRVGDPDKGTIFLTTPTWIAQARTFVQMQDQWEHMLKATVHGYSLMWETQKQRGLAYV